VRGDETKHSYERKAQPLPKLGAFAEELDRLLEDRLIYRTRRQGEEWKDIDELFPFLYTATNFAGRRQWLRCLLCGRRCRILYGGAYFRCRRCYGLKFESQYEPAWLRGISRAQKIRERYGGSGSLDEPFPAKPKGMHWRTYDRLFAEDERLSAIWTRGIGEKLGLSL